MSRCRSHLIVLVLWGLSSTANASGLYIIWPSFNGNSSLFTGVSGDGSAAAGFASNQPVYASSAGGVIPLGLLPGGNQGQGFGISGDGSTIVGWATMNWDDPYSSSVEAFRWTASEGMVPIGHLPGGYNSATAYDASRDGSVIVGSASSADAVSAEAFIWTTDTGMRPIGAVQAGCSYSEGFGVSDDGSVVVGQCQRPTNEVIAFRWTSSEGVITLGPAPATDSYARSISGDGTTIVGSFDGVPVKWDAASGDMEILANMGGIATAASLDGSVIVGTTTSVTGGTGAFLWDSLHGMRVLQTVLEEDYGLDLGGLRLTDAYGVSDDGRTFAGSATDATGRQFFGWILTVPEPSTVMLLGAGLFGLTARSRRMPAATSGCAQYPSCRGGDPERLCGI